MTCTIQQTNIDDCRRVIAEYLDKEGHRRFAGALFAGKVGNHEWFAACRSVALEIAYVNPSQVEAFDYWSAHQRE